MNALQIIADVRAHDAQLVIENDRLFVRGRGEPLPEELQRALHDHKAELLIALGHPIDRTVSAVLNEIRPYLPSSLRRLPDGRLLTLVNWALIAAFEAAIRKGSYENRAPIR